MASKESKPNLTHAQVSELVIRLYGLTESEIRPLPSYDDQNAYVCVSDGGEYVLKVMNSGDSRNPTLLELQTHAMNFLHSRGLPAQTAIPTKTGQLMSLEEIDCGCGLQKYLVRLLTYLPGTTVAKIPSSPNILYQVGKMAATMDKVFQEMEHPNLHVLQRENFIWSLSSIPLLEQYLPVMDGDPMQEVVSKVIAQYQAQVIPKMSAFRKCINHGDFNDHNILATVDGPSQYKISGILDFGDMSSGYYIFELAIAIMYMMIESPSPVDVGGHVLAGYESVIPLNEAERDCLFLLVLCRFSQSLVLARYSVQQQPENEEYLMITSRTGTKLLRRLWELGQQQVERTWFESAKTYEHQN
ncbi:hydroxylysine kinase [Alosa sapidissima]|uniref:hydroxylysine kinase n=1 Tax=Alosa sapidissima TaxID=34773 RepID=UPI001C085233|nr:hydroxylysine kinase [Alosa sapidissima]